MSMDALIAKIIKKSNPTVVGLDPKLENLPPYLVEQAVAKHGKSLKAAAEAIYAFNCGLIDALCGIVPAVKPQSAYYEMYGPEGVDALRRTIAYAQEKGLYVIADCKRNDIGSTAAAYAAAYLGSVQIGGKELTPFGADSVTVNGYLGSNGVEPFVTLCRERKKSIFVLVKTSNPSSSDLQDLVAGTRTVYRAMADHASGWGEELIGENGYSDVGFVVGKDLAGAFDRRGLGAIVNSSRGIIYAWKKTDDASGKNYQQAALDAAETMRRDLRVYC